MAERIIRLSANDNAPSGSTGGRLAKSVNSLARRQFKRFKRPRRLKPALSKTQLTGGEGIANGATRLVP